MSLIIKTGELCQRCMNKKAEILIGYESNKGTVEICRACAITLIKELVENIIELYEID